MSAPAGLARVTISAPQRRIDLALPERVPVAELLSEVLRQAGDGLADAGEKHGGWVLRRSDGAVVEARHDLLAQGVRDGDILHLVPARTGWPEPEYDDVVEAIADGARRLGRAWSAQATRLTGLSVAVVALAAGLATRPQWTIAAGVAGLLLLAGITAARGFGERAAGVALAAYAMPFAFTAGTGVASTTGAAAALVLVAGAAAPAIGAGLPVFAAGATAGLAGVSGAGLALWLPANGAAAVLLAVLACGIGAVPLLAVRLGRLPVALRPEPLDVPGAVRRTDELLTGLLLGHAVAAAVAGALLVSSGGVPGRLLVAVAGGVLLLRARLFVTVRQRLPVLLAGLSCLGTAVAATLARTPATVALVAAVAVALVAVGAGTAYATRSPSPYLGRAADLLDLVLVVSVVPIACAVLGLYARVGGLTG